MAIGATMVWEVRPTNGSNLNGGGYDSGVAGATTDYSQQNTAQESFTDLATADGTTTTVTSAAALFTSAMIGNVLHIESGTNWEPGFYVVTTFVSTSEITVDRSPTSAAGASGVGKVGGATKSFSGQTTQTLQANLVAGNKVWVKNEAWNESVALSVVTGTTTCTIEGYGSTRGDGTTEANRPLNDRNSAGAPIACNASGYILKYLSVTRSNGVGIAMSQSGVCVGCKSYSNASHGFSVATAPSEFIGCEANNNTGAGFSASTIAYQCHGCYSHDNTGAGYIVTTGTPTLRFCVSEANASYGLGSTTAPIRLTNCTVDGNTGAAIDGINMQPPNQTSSITNCIFSNNGRDGIRSSAASPGAWDAYNCFYGNGGTTATNYTVNSTSITTDPGFADRANGNFAVGTNMKALGFPGTFPGGLSIGYLDIGAVQRRELGGGLYRGGLM